MKRYDQPKAETECWVVFESGPTPTPRSSSSSPPKVCDSLILNLNLLRMVKNTGT